MSIVIFNKMYCFTISLLLFRFYVLYLFISTVGIQKAYQVQLLTFEIISCCDYSLKYGVIFKAMWQTVPFCKIILFILVGCYKDTTAAPTGSLLSFSYLFCFCLSASTALMQVCVFVCVCECVYAHIRMPAAMCNTVRARVEKHTPRIPETAAHMAYLLVLLLVEPFGFLIFKFSYTLESSFILWKS